MVPHGVPKLFGSFAPTRAANVLAPLGFPAPLLWAYLLGTLEIVGGLLLAVGFATRLIAIAFLVETTIILLFVSLPKGWIYSVPGGGADFPALLVVIFAALVFAGAGRFGVDDLVWRPALSEMFGR